MFKGMLEWDRSRGRLDLRLTTWLSLALVPPLAWAAWAKGLWGLTGALLVPPIAWAVSRAVLSRSPEGGEPVDAPRVDLLLQALSQASHDIRSPLTALELLLGRLAALPEAERVLARQAILRIKDIANGLLAKPVAKPPAPTRSVRPVPLLPLVQTVLGEKTTQLQGKSSVSLKLTADPRTVARFVAVCRIELARAISNVLDNAVEALSGRGVVRIAVHLDERESVHLVVSDNGKGMPEEVLRKIRLGLPITHGKAEGHGLGMQVVRQFTERWAGRLTIDSETGEGTTVRLVLPTVAPPAPFSLEIPLAGKRRVVVLDDDPCVHVLWRQRLRRETVEVVTFEGATQFCEWTSVNRLDDSTVFLVDQELGATGVDGLKLIRSLGIQRQAVLVTSHYFDEDLVDRCEAEGIRLLPKPLIPAVAISS